MKRRLYFAAVIVAAATALLVSWRHEPVAEWLPVALLTLFAVFADSMSFQLPIHGSVSLAFSATYAAMLYGGPTAAALTALFGSVSYEDVRNRKPLLDIGFNSAQLVISTLAAAAAYALLGGRALGAGGEQQLSGVPLVAAMAAATVFFLLNITMVGVAVSLGHNLRLREVFSQQGFAGYWVSLVVLALLGIVLAQLMAAASWLGLLLLTLPFMAARRTFRVYAELAEAYTSTVRSLVTAIEAKDPYTRGHSERVAVYARRLGERLALPRPQLELLERAALLHDVGKIGIELDTLSSPMQLTAEEVRLIRRHPALGSELVGDVEFLGDIVPVIRHHHERYDGAGYPDGLAGESIPLLARLMAVADSYDAMTSNRAYRPAMTQEEALAEIERVAGSQLDRQMALQFAAMLADDQDGGHHEA